MLDRVISLFEEMTSRLDKLPVMGGTSCSALIFVCWELPPPQAAFYSSNGLRTQNQVTECLPGCQWLQGHCFASSTCGPEELAWVLLLNIPLTATLGLPIAEPVTA